jgi:hypothetical protein
MTASSASRIPVERRVEYGFALPSATVRRRPCFVVPAGAACVLGRRRLDLAPGTGMTDWPLAMIDRRRRGRKRRAFAATCRVREMPHAKPWVFRYGRLFAVASACLAWNLVCAQTAADQSSRAPAFGVGAAPDAPQVQAGEPPAGGLAQAGNDASETGLPDMRVARRKLVQADAGTSALPSGADGDAAEEPTIRWGGFLEGLSAYTYSNPSHWSEAVARLQLTAQGELADEVKWKLGARVDVDPVYYFSNFYLDPVKRNQRLDFFYRENYLDFSAGDWDFRIGAQQIVWGEVVGLFFADVVSALDEREFLLPSFDIIRIPQGAARAEYTAGDSHLELVWIPIPAFDNIGKPGADFYPVPLPSPTPSQVAALYQDPTKPGHQLSNSSYGVRANTLVDGWDLAAFYYRSFSREPTFYRQVSDVADQPFTFQPRYDRIWQTGGTLSKDLSDFVLRAEAVYTYGQGYAVTDLSTPQGVVVRPTLDYILSAEWVLPGDTRVNVQGFQRIYFGGGGGDIAIKGDGFGASLFISTKLTSKLEPQLLWIQNFQHAGGLVRPRLNWAAAKNTTLGFGVDIFTGPTDGYFGRFNNRNRIYLEARYDF